MRISHRNFSTLAAICLLLAGAGGSLFAQSSRPTQWSPTRPAARAARPPVAREVQEVAYDEQSTDVSAEYEEEGYDEPAPARVPRAERRAVNQRARPQSNATAVGTGVRSSVRQTAYDTFPGETVMAEGESIVVGEAHLAAGETYYEGEIPYGVMPQSGPMADCNVCGPGGCGLFGCPSCPPQGKPCCICIPCPTLETLELHAGVHGFTGPANRGGTSSFGFHEGFNWGTPLYLLGIAGQIGVSGTHSNFDGSSITENDRNQMFVTAGLYRRVDCGLQMGVVMDYLHDEWDYAVDLVQLRGEISYRLNECNEFGFWFTQGMNDDSDVARQTIPGTAGQTFVDREVNFEITDLYAFFFRRQFRCGGEGRIYGGFTGESQGLVGGDLRIQLNQKWALENTFIYVTSGGDENVPDYQEDSWNVAIQMVWTPFAGRRGSCVPHPCRALLPVAHNGNFITRLDQP